MIINSSKLLVNYEKVLNEEIYMNKLKFFKELIIGIIKLLKEICEKNLDIVFNLTSKGNACLV